MIYTPRQIADFFLYVGKDDQSMTPMKIIKLVYIAHGWSLGLYNKPLITESPQAWKYGPVIPSLYDEFRQYGNQKIDIPVPENPIQDEKTNKLLEKIWNTYGKYTAIQLSAMTHEPETPWSITWEKAKKQYKTLNLTIPDNLIQEHYTAKKA
ncbi:DUF4065 domain-containing protein [Flavobacterium amniphilum]|uniref:Panacea domain-containing protein n=1 Tax=Flavobacterium amniphilum TaxID=1834035 RepID=UPI00202A31CF|nr:type II toxin-antitoxin system antitoxin SocA domain-containing protein [Flavobacterium amniphilum]MCL9804966.1 DUF4065 domain-containing protein [Flavobacterium amniphilum]